MNENAKSPPAACGWPPPPNRRATRWLIGGTDRIENLPDGLTITSISVPSRSRMAAAVSEGYP